MGRNKLAIHRRSAFGVVGLLGAVAAAGLICRGPLFAQAEKAGLLSEGVIRDGIVGRQELTGAERQQLDLNEDGVFDVADLIAFLKGFGDTPKASFESFTSVASEGVGTATVPIQFSRAFTGTLNYSLGDGSTATEETDFTPPGGSISVSGTSVEIPIPIVDDLELEAMETIELILEQGDGYGIDSPTSHRLFVDDNDVIWHGMMIQQGASRGFALEFRRNGATAQALLRGDDTGIIPPSDPPEAGWPVQLLEVTQDSFTAHIEGIPVPEEHTARLATTFTRSFVLEAEPTEPTKEGTILDTDAEIVGKLTERLIPDSPAFEHLARTITGSFVMIRARVRSNVPEAALQDLP